MGEPYKDGDSFLLEDEPTWTPKEAKHVEAKSAKLLHDPCADCGCELYVGAKRRLEGEAEVADLLKQKEEK